MQKINLLLEQYDALPDQENSAWDKLEVEFREKYLEIQVLDNLTDEESEKYDNELVELFNSLHEIELVDSDQEEDNIKTPEQINTENVEKPDTKIMEQSGSETGNIPVIEETENTTEMKNKKQEINSKEVKAETTETSQNQVVEEKTSQETQQMDQGGAIETSETPVFTENTEPVQQVVSQINVNPYQEFEQWASAQETVSAKDMVKFGLPESMWKVNKVEIVIGQVKLRKFTAGLLFNRWQVVK